MKLTNPGRPDITQGIKPWRQDSVKIKSDQNKDKQTEPALDPSLHTLLDVRLFSLYFSFMVSGVNV